MPIYEFTCDQCQERFEELVSASEAGGVTCPACGCAEVTRVFSSFAFKSDSGVGAAAGSGCSSCSQTSCSTCG